MFLGINLKKYKETQDGFKNTVGLVSLTAAIIIVFSILNIFTFGERDKAAETDTSREINTKVLSSLPKGRLNFLKAVKGINYQSVNMKQSAKIQKL